MFIKSQQKLMNGNKNDEKWMEYNWKLVGILSIYFK